VDALLQFSQFFAEQMKKPVDIGFVSFSFREGNAGV
jgi:hypothetical protein